MVNGRFGREGSGSARSAGPRRARITSSADEFGPGRDRRGGQAQAHARGRTRSRRQGASQDVNGDALPWPCPVMAFAMEPKATRRRGEGVRRAAPAPRGGPHDRRAPRRRETGEEIVAGLTEIHVEVIVQRMKDRFGAEVSAQAAAGALPRDDPRTGQGTRAVQEADRRAGASSATARSRSSRSADGVGLRVREPDQGRRDPVGLHPGGGEGGRGDDGARGRWPATRSRASGSRWWTARNHTVDSSEMAFKVAGVAGLQAGHGVGPSRCSWSRS